jgi:hypothetical protein
MLYNSRRGHLLPLLQREGGAGRRGKKFDTWSRSLLKVLREFSTQRAKGPGPEQPLLL